LGIWKRCHFCQGEQKIQKQEKYIYVVKEERAILQEYNSNRQTLCLAHQRKEGKRCTEKLKDKRKVKSRLGKLLLAEERKETNAESKLE
jgi:hypothetical protein